jgi:hypothetical protein
LILLIAGLATACSGVDATGSHEPSAKVPQGCISLPGELPERFVWAPQGNVLAVVSRGYKAGSTIDVIRAVTWPELLLTDIYEEANDLQILTIAPSAGEVYFLAERNGQRGIWKVTAGQGPVLLAATGNESTFDLQWTAEGILRVTGGVPVTDLSIWRTDSTGKTELLRTDHGVFGHWISADGSWIVEGNSGPAQATYTVKHSGEQKTLAVASEGELLGMTPDHSAVIYRPMSEDGLGGRLVLRLLPITGGEETSLEVPVALPNGVSLLHLSDQGVLAYSDTDGKSHEVCTVALDLSKN